MPSASASALLAISRPSRPCSWPMRAPESPMRLASPSYSMVAVSQAPSSEIEVRVLPSGETCRSDQPPKRRVLADSTRPPRHTRRPMILADGSSILKGCEEVLISSACSCATAGGGEAPAQAVASRQTTNSERRMERKVRRRVGSSCQREPCHLCRAARAPHGSP